MSAFEEWLSFYSSAFAYWLSQNHPKERNLLYSLLEDKRSHCIFYESLLLDFLIHHPRRIEEFRLYHALFRLCYGYFAKRMVTTMSHVAQRRELPQLFSSHFRSFTNHRGRALWERAQTRASLKPSALRRIWHLTFGTLRTGIAGVVALIVAPLALLWPAKQGPTLPEHVPELLEQTKAA